MRIVLSNASSSWGGVHRVTEVLARGLQARGHDVLVIGRAGSMLEERMRTVAPFAPLLGGLDLGPLTLWRTARALRRHRTQVMVALMKKDVRLTAVAARTLRVPVVIRHYYEQPLPPGWRGKLLYGGAAMHVTNAEATRRILLASAPWLDPGRIEVIYNGIDTTSYLGAEPAQLYLPGDAIRFGFLANITPRKGIVELAQAWQAVAQHVPNAHLVIAGKGSHEDRFRELLAGAPRVHWLGYRRDVPAVLAALDVVVLASHKEGAPNVVLEAMAARKAIIATAVSGTPEIVRDGIEARLVHPRDPTELAAVMIELARDAALRAGLASAACQRVLRDFTLDAMIDRYEDLLSRIASRD